jgi:hypothetical protein
LKILSFITIITALTLAGCSVVAQAQPPSESAIQTAIAQTQMADGVVQTAIAQTQMAAPPTTAVPSPTPTTEPTNTPIPPTPTPTEDLSTPTPDFSGASILNHGRLQSGNYLVTIQLPFEVEEEYRATVDEETYDCEILEDYPDRLYCSGPDLSPGEYTIYVYFLEQTDEEEALFSLEFTVTEEDTTISDPQDGNYQVPQKQDNDKDEEPNPDPYPEPPDPYP